MNTPNNAAALERIGAALFGKDLYAVLMDVQNGIDSPGLVSMANSAIRSIDAVRDEFVALRATLTQPDALTSQPSEVKRWQPSSFMEPGRSHVYARMQESDHGAFVLFDDYQKLLNSQPSGEAVAIPVVQQTAPERIWLAVADDAYYADKPFPDGEEVCWSSDAPLQVCVPYVRADLATHPSSDAPAGVNSSLRVAALALADLAERNTDDLDLWQAAIAAVRNAADAPGVAVDEAMVDRAAKAYCKWFVCGSNGVNTLALRAALTAALAPKPEG